MTATTKTVEVTTDKKKIKAKREAIVMFLRQFVEENGRTPTVADLRGVRARADRISYQSIYRYFGSLDEALKAAGFEAKGRGRPPS